MELKNVLFKMLKHENSINPSLNFFNISFTSTNVISGLKDSGKTFFMSEIAKKCNRYIVWDSRYERVQKITPFTSRKAKLIIDKNIHITTNPDDVGLYDRIIFHPYAKNKKDMIALFDLLCKKVYQAKNYMLFIEEADSIADRYAPLCSGLFELVQGNIHVNCGLFFVSRRMQNLNPDITRLADNLFIFKYSNKDREYLTSYIGEELPLSIPERAFFHYDGKELKYYEAGISVKEGVKV